MRALLFFDPLVKKTKFKTKLESPGFQEICTEPSFLQLPCFPFRPTGRRAEETHCCCPLPDPQPCYRYSKAQAFRSSLLSFAITNFK